MYHNYTLNTAQCVKDIRQLASHIDSEASLQDDDALMSTLREYAGTLDAMAGLLEQLLRTS